MLAAKPKPSAKSTAQRRNQEVSGDIHATEERSGLLSSADAEEGVVGDDHDLCAEEFDGPNMAHQFQQQQLVAEAHHQRQLQLQQQRIAAAAAAADRAAALAARQHEEEIELQRLRHAYPEQHRVLQAMEESKPPASAHHQDYSSLYPRQGAFAPSDATSVRAMYPNLAPAPPPSHQLHAGRPPPPTYDAYMHHEIRNHQPAVQQQQQQQQRRRRPMVVGATLVQPATVLETKTDEGVVGAASAGTSEVAAAAAAEEMSAEAMQQLIVENVSLRQRVSSLTAELQNREIIMQRGAASQAGAGAGAGAGAEVGTSATAAPMQQHLHILRPENFAQPTMEQPAVPGAVTMVQRTTSTAAVTHVKPPFMSATTAELAFRQGLKFVLCSTGTCGQWLQVRVDADIVHCPKCSLNTACPRLQEQPQPDPIADTPRAQSSEPGGIFSCVQWIFS